MRRALRQQLNKLMTAGICMQAQHAYVAIDMKCQPECLWLLLFLLQPGAPRWPPRRTARAGTLHGRGVLSDPRDRWCQLATLWSS